MRLKIDQGIAKECRATGSLIAEGALQRTEGYTSRSVERATARTLGAEGSVQEIPYANELVDILTPKEAQGRGLCNNFTSFADSNLIQGRMEFIKDRKRQRDELRIFCEGYEAGKPVTPPGRTLRYVLTATGDVDHDVTHALAVAEAGGDIVAVIRSTAQSLLDYVPEGLTHEGYGGTFATQANFRHMREALDEWSEKNGRYVRLSSFCSGLCMPEIAVIGALEGLDNLVNDGMYGILYRDINPLRTIIDQRFARMINGWAGIVINTGEDNYPRTADPMDCMPSVVASWFINHALAAAAGVPDEQIALGLAYEVHPEMSRGLGYELAHAMLLRELWPDCPVKYMPPTKYMDGNLSRTQTTDTLFNLVTELTQPGIQTIGVPTEGIFTPHIHDRVIGMEAVNQVAQTAYGLHDAIEIKADGWVAEYAEDVLNRAYALLLDIVGDGLFGAIANGTFGDVKRPTLEGKGLDGVIEKADGYWNPVEDWILDGN